mgnify:CR=1 FL=1
MRKIYFIHNVIINFIEKLEELLLLSINEASSLEILHLKAELISS